LTKKFKREQFKIITRESRIKKIQRPKIGSFVSIQKQREEIHLLS